MFAKLLYASLLSWLLLVQSLPAQTPPLGQRWTDDGRLALTQSQGDVQGDPWRLTWGFARELTGPTFIPAFGDPAGGNSNLIARMDAIYGAGPGGNDLTLRPWFNNYQSTFDRWGSISGLSFQHEANDDGVQFTGTNNPGSEGVLGRRADIRIGGRNIDGNGNVLAFNFFPNSGEMVIDTNDSFYNSTANNSRGLRNVLAHEVGHGIGMSHLFSNNSNQLMEPFINNSFDGPQFHDILVAQHGYGDFNEKSFNGLGNDVAARATSLGLLADGATLSIGNSARSLTVDFNAIDFFSIDSSTDIDFWSFSVDTAGTVDIFLEALGFTYNTQPQGNDGNPMGENVAFNTRQRSDLSLSLFDTDGTSLLFSANEEGLGGNESIDDFFLTAAGTYFVRITGIDNPDSNSLNTQFYGLSLNFVAVPEPGALGVLAIGLFGLLRRRRVV